MTNFMPWEGPEWFARLWPCGLTVDFGDDQTEFTLLEAAVFALAGPGMFNWCDEAIAEEIGTTLAAVRAIKSRLRKKYDTYRRRLGPRGNWLIRLFRE